ncbi:MAG: winged helix-turn-helix transcriptional regulator [Anaerolineae bacterium]|nr:winged helix-turn-helix transcriptional regulator [Anaerolineae bacterium]
MRKPVTKAEAINADEAEPCTPNLNLLMRFGQTETEQFAAVFKALGNPVRLKMIDLISQGRICSCDIERYFDLTQPTISHHLKVLRDAGVVQAEARGVWVFYELNPSTLMALEDLLRMTTRAKR